MSLESKGGLEDAVLGIEGKCRRKRANSGSRKTTDLRCRIKRNDIVGVPLDSE